MNGTFKVVDGVIIKLRSTDISKFDKARLIDLTSKMVNDDLPFDTYTNELKKNKVLSELIDLFPKSRQEKLALIKFTGKVLLACLTWYTASELVSISIQNTEIINQIFYEEQQQLDIPNERETKELDLEQEEQPNILMAIDFISKKKR
ncbi:hypothetical protein AJ85_00155 [Alkalihalobacillus alcalophilus ATCC 27647 = CGMCC 1.3604]|uniref:Uncharacterized protein n=1 Tax=Alkalihalobacillus alcalophilus ATCC 27647 = CGMCC 1.3604 TaxID=1218173 RepID=A0A094WFK9_ALKAL|nr:hypothetical protein [Alkalihalobacillus alcalophilus]KGA95556.1 hypothetical protein BALCAV_0221865 [Alkalihalobacillus alcalophilus ATCC 27647 = CGMCC 1.3604]MED1564339.1 hypothetical protein [Alkalihalobacillus alcalophilus]THG88759.1 hypothetical protein AJ85_00155 [Alkalihalobacillus alcalophilus ATCC 27647 = CGMCC 1.3604]